MTDQIRNTDGESDDLIINMLLLIRTFYRMLRRVLFVLLLGRLKRGEEAHSWCTKR